MEDERRGIAVIGFYEPIPGLDRNRGKVVIMDKGGIRDEIDDIYDDTMLGALESALRFFEGDAPNPYPVTRAIDSLEILKLW